MSAPQHDLELATETARVDSLAAIGQAARASARFQRVLPWVLGALLSASTTVLGWVGAKMDTRLEMLATLQLRADLERWNADRVRDHAELVAEIQALRNLLLRQDVNDQGRVPRLEGGVYLAFRALAEVRAAALTAESSRARALKEFQAGRFARSFDARVKGREPAAVYDELFTQVAVP